MPRVKLFNEKEVLSKAMNLFWKQGYSATSIQDLVDFLGINRASLYDTYGGKEQLFLSAFDQYRNTNTQATIKFLERQSNVKEGFRKLFLNAIDESLTDKENKGCFVVNAIAELVPGDEKIYDTLKKNKDTFQSAFYEFLLRGEAEGQFEKGKDLKTIAALLFTLYNGLKIVTKVNPDKDELIKSVNQILVLLD